MDSEIQFGDLNHQDPSPQVRPDNNQHFAVAPCGEIDDQDLPIFVDLDAMRDMEAHAQTNTQVELGGVLLGQQCVDQQGRPFVLVTDSLRAEHYEATKGSFKFTHQTWEQISRQREQFPDELQMVGWYHTHPDWGVFLSGMDMFICDHFFNRPLDVALVIDPCGNDRGWFQWTSDRPAKVRQTNGFYLVASRFRREEVEFFAAVYAQAGTMAADSRYVSPMGGPTVQPIVNINDQRTPIQNIAIMGMLTMQFLVLAVIAIRLILPAGEVAAEKADQRLASIESQIQGIGQIDRLRLRDEAYQEILSAIVASTPENNVVVGEYVRLREQADDLSRQVEGQLALNQKMREQRDQAISLRESVQNALSESNQKLADAHKEISTLKNAGLSSGDAMAESEKPWIQRWTTWLMVACGALVLLLAGAMAGYSLRRVEVDRALDDDQADPVEKGKRIELPPEQRAL